MKRTPLRRKTPLRSNPDQVRAWEERTRANALDAARQRAGAGEPRTTPRRRTPIKPVNRKRREAERLRAYGPKERREFVTSHPCFTCGMLSHTEQAHLVSGGMGRKADASTVLALCHFCHAEQHRLGNADFAAEHGLTVADLFAEAERMDAAWRDHSA